MTLCYCRHCHGGFRLSVRGFAYHEQHCPQNPQRIPIKNAYEATNPKTWLCPGCARLINFSHRNRHRCRRPRVLQLQGGDHASS